MYRELNSILSAVLVTLCSQLPSMAMAETTAVGPASRPNILLILVDDLGYSDLGCYGSEISTPHLDGLAAQGLRYTQFYNTARCWPSRAALMTGYYAQSVRRDTLPGIPSGGRGIRPEWAHLVPKIIGSAGYRSYHSGKWHIDGMPLENGFDRSYYIRDQGRFFNPKVRWEDDEKLPAVEPGSDYYETIHIADHAIGCLKQHHSKHAGQPFFQYVAFTAPHFPLMALPEDIAKYQGTYDVGWNAIRAARYQRQRELGLLDVELSEPELEIGPPYHFPEALEILGEGEVNRPVAWENLTPQQQQFQADKMEVHAAMVDRVDQEVGRILTQLKEMQVFDNTLVLFLSDNGASAEIMVRDDGHDPEAPFGSAASYLCLGPGWSTACNTPFRRHKTWVHEGGISTPLIAHWPMGIPAQGEIRRQVGHVIDVVPTLLELAQITPSAEENGQPVPDRPGRSLVKSFGTEQTESRVLWWWHEQNRAMRIGDWKLVASGENAPWEIYNLAEDRTEQNNLIAAESRRALHLEAAWLGLTEEFTKMAKQDLPPNGSPNKKPKGQ